MLFLPVPLLFYLAVYILPALQVLVAHIQQWLSLRYQLVEQCVAGYADTHQEANLRARIAVVTLIHK